MKTIIEMAREADGLGFVHDAGDVPSKWQFTPKELERFAALVRADERELVLAAAIDGAEHAARKAIADEREACAKVCEDEICNCCWDEQAGAVAEHLAATIRARGNT